MTQQTATVPAVYAGIEHAQRALASMGIDKSSENAAQGFNFRGIDAVLGAMSKVLVAARLAVVPTVEEHRTDRITDAKTGKTKFLAQVRVEYRITSLVDGSSLSTAFCGEAIDAQDKSTSKALSMAYKYFAFQTFCIPLEGVLDDADADSPMQEPRAEQPKATVGAPTLPAPDSVDDAGEKLLAALKVVADAQNLANYRNQIMGFKGSAVFADLKTAYKDAQKRVETKA